LVIQGGVYQLQQQQEAFPYEDTYAGGEEDAGGYYAGGVDNRFVYLSASRHEGVKVTLCFNDYVWV